jgi:hypothetical protein
MDRYAVDPQRRKLPVTDPPQRPKTVQTVTDETPPRQPLNFNDFEVKQDTYFNR